MLPSSFSFGTHGGTSTTRDLSFAGESPYGGVLKWGYLPNHRWIFHYKPSILGHPMAPLFMETLTSDYGIIVATSTSWRRLLIIPASDLLKALLIPCIRQLGCILQERNVDVIAWWCLFYFCFSAITQWALGCHFIGIYPPCAPVALGFWLLWIVASLSAADLTNLVVLQLPSLGTRL